MSILCHEREKNPMNGFDDGPRPAARPGCAHEGDRDEAWAEDWSDDAEDAAGDRLPHVPGMWELWPRPRFVTLPGRAPVDLEALSDVILD